MMNALQAKDARYTLHKFSHEHEGKSANAFSMSKQPKRQPSQQSSTIHTTHSMRMLHYHCHNPHAATHYHHASSTIAHIHSHHARDHCVHSIDSSVVIYCCVCSVFVLLPGSSDTKE